MPAGTFERSTPRDHAFMALRNASVLQVVAFVCGQRVPARVEEFELPMGVFNRYFKRLAFALSWNQSDESVSLVGRTRRRG